MQFEYPVLEALAAVVREGTFEAAARSLNITQSAVSQRIKLLEKRTGAVLIVRGRPCVATEYGQKLCRHIEQVQLLEYDLKKTLSTIDDPRAEIPATIRIAVNTDSLETWFPEVVLRASRELNITFDIVPDDQEHTAERLRSGEALAAVTASDKPVHGCKRLSLGALDYIAVASPSYMETAFSRGVTVEAIEHARHLVFDRKDTLPEQWMMLALGEIAPSRCHWVPSISAHLACCLNGAGWGLMPYSSIDGLLAEGRLVELMPGKLVNMSLHWQWSAQGSEIMKLLTAIVSEVARLRLSPDRYRS